MEVILRLLHSKNIINYEVGILFLKNMYRFTYQDGLYSDMRLSMHSSTDKVPLHFNKWCCKKTHSFPPYTDFKDTLTISCTIILQKCSLLAHRIGNMFFRQCIKSFPADYDFKLFLYL